MPKHKKQRKSDGAPVLAKAHEEQAAPEEILDFDSLVEPSWLSDDTAAEAAPDLDMPAWLSAPQTEPANPAVAEEPESSLFLASAAAEAMADLATMENAVRRADLPHTDSAPPPLLDEFPSEPEWAVAEPPPSEPNPPADPVQATAVHAFDAAASQQADIALRSIVDQIDAQMMLRASASNAVDASPNLDDTAVEIATAQHVVFYLGASRYSLPIDAVTEVNTVPRITHLPGIPHYVRGVANLRGEILPVLDMRGLLGLPRTANAVLERMLVVRFAGQDALIGFVVDRVRGLARLDQTRIAHPRGLADDAVLRFIEGVTEFENEVLNVLSPGRIFQSEEVRTLSGN